MRRSSVGPLLRVHALPWGAALALLAMACGSTVTVDHEGSSTGGNHSGGTDGMRSTPSSGGASSTGGASAGGATSSGGTTSTGGDSSNSTWSSAPSSSGGVGSTPCKDSDGDGISDADERYDEDDPSGWDTDGDMTADYLDQDSDGDLVLDVDEAGGVVCDPPRDTDGDGRPDYIDFDSDDDYVQDIDEVTHGLNPLLVDSDDDGCEDIAEFNLGQCDPSKIVLHAPCQGEGTGTGTLVVGRGFPGRLNDVSLVVEPWVAAQQGFVKADVIGVTPPMAGTIESGVLTEVEPGARVSLQLWLSSSWEGVWRWTVQLRSASRGVVGQSDVLWIVDRCPMVE